MQRVQKGRSWSPSDLVVDDDRVVTSDAPAESTHLRNIHCVLGAVSGPRPGPGVAVVWVPPDAWKALLRATGVYERVTGDDPHTGRGTLGIRIGP